MREEAGAPGENQGRLRENMHPPHRKAPGLGIKPATFLLWSDSADHCTTVSPFPLDVMKSSSFFYCISEQPCTHSPHFIHTYYELKKLKSSWNLYSGQKKGVAKQLTCLNSTCDLHLLASTYRALASRALMTTLNNGLLRAGDETSTVLSCMRKCWNPEDTGWLADSQLISSHRLGQ